MKTKLKTTLALLAAFCGLQLFTATTAWAATIRTWTTVAATPTTGEITASNWGNQYDHEERYLAFKVDFDATDYASATLVTIAGNASNLTKLETTADGHVKLSTKNGSVTAESTATVAGGSSHVFTMLFRRGIGASGSGNDQCVGIVVYMDGVQLVQYLSQTEKFGSGAFNSCKFGAAGKQNAFTAYHTGSGVAASVWGTETGTMNGIVQDSWQLIPVAAKAGDVRVYSNAHLPYVSNYSRGDGGYGPFDLLIPATDTLPAGSTVTLSQVKIARRSNSHTPSSYLRVVVGSENKYSAQVSTPSTADFAERYAAVYTFTDLTLTVGTTYKVYNANSTTDTNTTRTFGMNIVKPRTDGYTVLAQTNASTEYCDIYELTTTVVSVPTVHETTIDSSKDWTALSWDPSWPTGGGATHSANITVGATSTLNINENETMYALKVTSAAAKDLTLAKGDGVTATVSAYDFSGASGKVTVNYDTGTTPITAGSDTVLNGTGTGLITLPANGKATVGYQHFGSGSLTVSGGGSVVGPNTSTLVFDLGEGNQQQLAGSSDTAADHIFGMTVKSGTLYYSGNSGTTIFNKRTMTADGATAKLKIAGGDATGYNTTDTKIVLKNGGTFVIGKRDTCKAPVELTGGHVLLLKDCNGGSRGLDLFGNPSTWTVKAASGASAGSPTVSSIDYEDGASDNDRKLNIRSGAWNVTVDANARFDINATLMENGDGQTPGKLVKMGAGTMVLKVAGTYTKGTEVQAGTLKVEASSALGTGAVSVSSGATLETTSALSTLANNLTLNSGAILKPSAALTVSGTFTGSGYIIDAANLTPSEGATVLTIPSGSSFGAFALRNVAAGWALTADGSALKFTQNVSTPINVSDLSAGQGFGFSGDVTLNFDQAPSWDGKVAIGTSGKLKLTGYMDVTPAMLAKFDLGYNTLDCAWHTRKVISLNFGSGMTADASDGSLAGYVKANSWVNDNTSCTATDRPINKIWNGTASESLTGVTASWSGGGSVYGAGSTEYVAQFQKAYIDDKADSDTTVTVSGIPFTTYDVILYYSSDDTGTGTMWKAPQVNGNFYKCDTDGTTMSATAQTDKWGVGKKVETKVKYGKNAIRVSGLSGALTVNTGNRTNGRSSFAAIQIIDCSNVAQVGETQYPTLAAAVDAVEASGTVTLLADCAGTVYTDKTFTLDLNGHALAAEMTIGGTVTLAGDETGSAMTGTIRGTGTLVITDGITVTANNGANGYAVYGTAVTINNGTLKLNNGNEDAKVYNATFTIGENGALTNYGWMTFDGTVTLASDYTKTVLDYNNAKIRGSGTIVKNGSGTITLGSIPQEGSNGHPITVNAGTLILPAGDYDTSKVPVTVKDGAAIKIKLTQQQQIDGYTANVTFETSGTVTFIKPDGTTEVAGTGEGGNVFKPELPTGLLRYGYAFNNNLTAETGASATLTINGSHTYEAGLNDPEKALKLTNGQNYGDNFGFGGGDFTIVAVVKAPTEDNKCIFGLGGYQGTAGLLGLRRKNSSTIAIFTANGTDLKEVTVADAATKYHTYALRYNSTTHKLAISVDFGAYSDEVNYTSSTAGQFQFGGVNAGSPSIALNANDGDIDEFQLYTAQLSVECLKQAVPPFYPSYEATIPADAVGPFSMSQLNWYPSVSTLYANKSWKIINNASADVTTVNVDGDAAKTKVTVVSATKVLKFGSPSKLNASAYDFSQAQGGVGFGVTGGWTVPDVLKNYIRDNNVKVIFDSTNSGATLDYSSENIGTISGHYVFSGGTHVFKMKNGNASQGFGTGATADNPTFYVKDGATVNAYLRDPCGWNAAANVNGILRIGTDSYLNITKLSDNTIYFSQRFYFENGSTLSIDSDYFRLNGGYNDQTKAQLYMPADGGTATLAATGSGGLRIWNDNNPGAAADIGANSTLVVSAPFVSCNASSKFNKYGAGTLKFTGDVSAYNSTLTVNGGTLLFASTSALNASAVVSVASGAIVEFDTTDVAFSNVISGEGSVVKSGSGTTTLSGANTYSGGTTVQAGTLEITGSGTIGSGDYSVAAGATLDLGTHRPAGNLLGGSTAGTIEVTLTSEESTNFNAGSEVQLLSIDGAFAGTLRVFDSTGERMHTVDVKEGKIVITKVAQRVSPFNLNANGTEEPLWTEQAWMDSSDPAQAVQEGDWAIEVGANIAVAQGGDALLVPDCALTINTLNITNAGELEINDYSGTFEGSLTATTINDSASTGETSLNFPLGTANVTAGANTIIGKTGGGTLTVGADKKATLADGATMGGYSNVAGGTIRFEGTRGEVAFADYMPTAGNYEFKNATLTGTMKGATYNNRKLVVRADDAVTVTPTLDGYMCADFPFDVKGGSLTYTQSEHLWFVNNTYTVSGGTVTINANGDGSGTTKSVIFGYSSGTMEINVSGGLLDISKTALMSDAVETINLSGDGTLKIKGFKKNKPNNQVTFNVGGTSQLLVGSIGIAALNSTTINLNGGTLKAFEDSTVANAITLGADSTFAADAGATLKVSGAVTGSSNIAIAGDGSVVFMQSSGVTPTKVTSGTAYYGFGVDINEAGVFTVPSGYTASSIKLYNAAGQPVTITGYSETEVYYECKMSDFSAWWKYEFNTSLSNDGTEGTALTWDGGSKFPQNEAYLTNIVWKGEVATTNIGIRVPCRPYRSVDSWPTTATFVMYGKMPSENNTVLIGFGSQTHPKDEQGGTPEMRNTIFLAVGDASKGEVKLCQVQNFSASTELCTMSVANATTTDHLYAFVIKVVNDKTVINTYLDGQLLQPYTFDGVITLGKGFQLGSIHGGTNDSGYTAPTAASAISVIDFLRVYQEELNSAAMAKYAQEYPYESPNGVFERTLSGTDGTWIQEGQWLSNDVEYVSQPLANGVVQINATADTGLAVNLPADVTYESIAFGGNGKITLTNDTEKTSGIVKIQGRIGINTDTVLANDAFETIGSAISISDGKKLTLDCANVDVGTFWASTNIDLTGAVICGDYTKQVELKMPNVKLPRTATKRMDPQSLHIWVDITVPTNDIIGTVSGGNITWSWANTAIDEADIDFDQTEVAIKIVMGENENFTLNEDYAKADLITVNGGNLNIGTYRDMTVAGKGTVDVQLTEEESSSTTELTLFNVTGTADLAFRTVTDYAGQPKTDFIGGNGKIIVNPPATTLTGLHILRIMPKATSRTEDRDPNGRDSGWIDLINYGPAETNLANYQIIRTNLGKEYKTKVGKLLSRTVAKGQIYRIYTSEEYPTAEDYGGDGKTVKAYAKNGEGVVVEDANGIIIVPTKVNPKKYPMVRLVEGSTNIIDEVIVPNDLDDNMQIEVVANADKLERKVVYPDGRATVEYGPAVDAVYGIDGVKSDLKLLNKAKFATVGADYKVVFPVNPFKTGSAEVLDANTITNVVLEYRVFDPVEANMPVKSVTNLVMSTATSEKEIANYGAGCQLWTGKIPAEAMVAGKLVQFRAKIFDKGGKVWTAPRNLNPDIGHIWYGVVAQPETTTDPSDTTKVCTANLDTYLMFVSGYNIAEMDKDIDSQDKTKVPYGARCAIYDAKNGVYYDNVRIDLRGQTSRTFTKKSHGLRFSKIAPLKCTDPFTGVEYELRKTSFIAEYGDPAYIRQTLALRVMRTAGVKAPFNWPSRLYRNGTYYQLAFNSNRFTDEAVEDIYGLNKYGYAYKNVGELLSSGWASTGTEKKTPDDDVEKGTEAMAVISAYADRFNDAHAADRTAVAMKEFNIPAWINYLAATKITQECDDVWTNLGIYIDKYEYFLNKNGDDTIRPLAYDQNLSFGVWYYGDDTGRGRIGIVATNDTMKSHPLYGGKEILYHKADKSTINRWNRGMETIYQNETYRNAMVRRLRTLMEVFYGSNDATQDETPIWQWATEYWDAIAADVPVDHSLWQYNLDHMTNNVSAIWVWNYAPTLEQAKTDLWDNFIVPHRKHLFVTHAASSIGTAKTHFTEIGYAATKSAGIPETQTATATLKDGISLTTSEGTKIVTGETKITDGIVGIQNTNNEAIDMSYWQLDGVATLTFAPGTVLPAGTQANPGKLWIVLDRRAAASKIAESDIPMIINVDKNAGETVSGEPQINLKDAEGNVVETCQFYITITTVDEKTVAVVSYEPPAGGTETQLPMDWMVEHGIDTKGNAAQLSTNMNVKVEGGNGATPWESYALGLAPEDPESKPVIAPVQTSDKDNVTFKLTNVDGAGADTKNFNVQYRVWAGSTPGAKEGEPSATVGYDATQSMPLPNEGVKYYTIEVITTQKPATP